MELSLNIIHNDWTDLIDSFTFAYNTTSRKATHYSPFELVFGRFPKIPNEFQNELTPIYDMDNNVLELKELK